MRWRGFLVLCTVGCRVRDPAPILDEWHDDFNRPTLGQDYFVGARGPDPDSGWRLEAGALRGRNCHNRPLWLRRKLPRDVRIEVVAWSNDPRGDLKLEVFGDGHGFDPDGGAYQASSYVLVFGGWHNTRSQIARLDEHGSNVTSKYAPKVVPGQRYRFRIEREGAMLTWFVDDFTQPFLQYKDPQPLEGPGHEYLGFGNWEAESGFDDLTITPLGTTPEPTSSR